MLFLGAIVFLFPFYYMIIGSLQTTPDPTLGGCLPEPGNLTLDNYVAVNERINLLQGLVNSGIFTGGVLLGTVVFGVLVGYALAVLQWRGRGVTFALVLLVQVIPFQLLMIPLYVLIARDYGLSDNYLGHDPAVRHQLDGGDHLPAVLPAAAEGALRGGPHRRRRRAAHPAGASRSRWCDRRCSRSCCSPSSARGTSSSGRS